MKYLFVFSLNQPLTKNKSLFSTKMSILSTASVKKSWGLIKSGNGGKGKPEPKPTKPVKK